MNDATPSRYYANDATPTNELPTITECIDHLESIVGIDGTLWDDFANIAKRLTALESDAATSFYSDHSVRLDQLEDTMNGVARLLRTLNKSGLDDHKRIAALEAKLATYDPLVTLAQAQAELKAQLDADTARLDRMIEQAGNIDERLGAVETKTKRPSTDTVRRGAWLTWQCSCGFHHNKLRERCHRCFDWRPRLASEELPY